MRNDKMADGSKNAIMSYFNKACMPTQQETLGLIVSEIIREGRTLSRPAICTKLLRRVELAENDDEIAHYNELISLFFKG